MPTQRGDSVITIDQEFRSLIPPLTDAELQQLEASLVSEGCRDALVVWKEENILLDGHHRKAICEAHGIEYKTVRLSFPGRNEALMWVIRNQMGRRNLTPYQRAELALRLKPLIAAKAKENERIRKGNQPGATIQKSGNLPIGTDRELAKAAGVSHDTIHKAAVIAEKAPEEVKERLRAGETSINREYQDIIKEERRIQREKERSDLIQKSQAIAPDERWSVQVADIHTYQPDRQFDFIITDPPYPKEYLELYTVLAERALEWLKPNGLLLAMCGQSYFDQVMNNMAQYLEYYWTGCYLLPGQPTPLRQRQVNTVWKPVVIFSLPGNKYKGKIFGDTWKSDENDKAFHKWGQSESGMLSIISQVCLPGQSILDPFCGAGTTGVAALKHGCLFEGIDIDESSVDIAKARLGDVE